MQAVSPLDPALKASSSAALRLDFRNSLLNFHVVSVDARSRLILRRGSSDSGGDKNSRETHISSKSCVKYVGL